MKKIFFILFILSTVYCHAQTEGTLAANTSKFSNYIFNTTDISREMPTVRTNSGSCFNGWVLGAYIFGFSGGYLIGWPIGEAIGGGDPQWYLAGIGTGLVGVAFLFDVLGKKRCNGFAYQPKEQRSIYAVKEKKHQLGVLATGNTVGFSLSL